MSDPVLCLGKIHQNPESNEAWEERSGWIKSSQSYRNFDGINGEPTEFEWNIFPGFDTLQLCDKVKDLLSGLGETPENFTGRILLMSMFNDISCGTKDNEQECLAHARVGGLVQDNGHSLVPVLRKVVLHQRGQAQAILSQAILSQEAYGILLLPLHSNRIDCCLSPSCV